LTVRSSPEAVARSGEERPRRLTELVALPRRSPLYPELARALAAADRLHVFPTDLLPVPVRATSATSQSGCYRMRLGDPIDLRVSRRHDRVPLSFLHELGHLLDHQLAPAPRAFASPRTREFGAWRTAVGALASRAPEQASGGRRRYLDSWRELWARSYAQTVLERSDDPILVAQLRALQENDDVFVWPAAAFEPVAGEVEGVLAGLAASIRRGSARPAGRGQPTPGATSSSRPSSA
jgi:hypothetical protein